MQQTADVLIVGAGAAGLAAARELTAAGLNVVVLEARDRIGGRIYTQREAEAAWPIELGAEFIHGAPPETLKMVEQARLLLCDVPERHWYLRAGVLTKSGAFWAKLDDVMAQMKRAGQRDQSFREFLDAYDQRHELGEAKAMAEMYVQGFHAARLERIGVLGLNKVNEAADKIDGDKQFRLLDGYGRIAQWLYTEALAHGAKFHLDTEVKEVRWRKDHVEIRAKAKAGLQHYEATRALMTLPLGVLHAPAGEAGAVRFIPALVNKAEAANRLAMGQVVKITLRFRARFWEELKLPAQGEHEEDLAQFAFLHAPDELIPTWWTQLPVRVPLLVGWVGGPRAEQLLAKGAELILKHALEALARMLVVPLRRIEELLAASYIHDWQADPYARGAYSYVPVGSLDAQAQLAQPVAATLFFAGEATNTEGHSGTVHGAIATGNRAAREIIKSR